MASRGKFGFTWDLAKERANRRKHGITFEATTAVFHDPLLVTLHNRNHGSSEECWTTIGLMGNGTLAVVVHAFYENDKAVPSVRIISARKASKHERREYESGNYSIQEPAMADQHKVTDELEMEDEYDFSKGERGKFYRQDAVFLIPVWLDPDVMSHFMARAKLEGVETTELLNNILRRQIEPAAAAGPPR